MNDMGVRGGQGRSAERVSDGYFHTALVALGWVFGIATWAVWAWVRS